MDHDRELQLLKQLREWEDLTTYLYQDDAKPPHGPNVTIAIGCLIGSVDAAQRLPFQNFTAGRPASPSEVAREFERVHSMIGGLPAWKYRARAPMPRIELTETAALDLALGRLHEAVGDLRVVFPTFDRFPVPAQDACVDLRWNLGPGRYPHDGQPGSGFRAFVKLIAACRSGNWRAAAAESRVSTSREARNAERASRFLSCIV
jgi:hypothetical protein